MLLLLWAIPENDNIVIKIKLIFTFMVVVFYQKKFLIRLFLVLYTAVVSKY